MESAFPWRVEAIRLLLSFPQGICGCFFLYTCKEKILCLIFPL